MYCFNFFRNQLWRHLISYNSFRNVNMCLVEVVMCENAEAAISSRTEGLKSLGLGDLPIWRRVLLLGDGGSVPHYMPLVSYEVWIHIQHFVDVVINKLNIY